MNKLIHLLTFLGIAAGVPAYSAGRPNAWQIADVSAVSGSGGLHYANKLTADEKITATNRGWHFTVVSRLVQGSGNNTPAMSMIYGDGTRRFAVYWDTDANGNLRARLLFNGTAVSNYVLRGFCEADSYHTHELSYDPDTRLATYRFDGWIVATWAGQRSSAQSGTALWGANSSAGRGRMNFNRVAFSVGFTSWSYYAGYEGEPSVAMNPTNQNWFLTRPAIASAVNTAAVIADNFSGRCCVTNVYVNTAWVESNSGVDPDGAGPATALGIDAFSSLYSAVSTVCAGGNVWLAAGRYAEPFEIVVNRSVSVIGAGAALTELTGSDEHRVLVIDSSGSDPRPCVRLSGLTICHGFLSERTPFEVYSEESRGAGLRVGYPCQVTAERCVFRDNAGLLGGAVQNQGTMLLLETEVRDNRVMVVGEGRGGGGIHNGGILTLVNSTVSGNQVNGTRNGYGGGGIWNERTLAVSNSVIASNGGDNCRSGGGIFNLGGEVSVVSSAISNNLAMFAGGGIANSHGRVSMMMSTISGNRAAGSGGGIYHFYGAEFGFGVTVANTTISGNQTDGNGGGVMIDSYDNILMTSVTVVGNRADADGNGYGRSGGIYFYQGQPAVLQNSIVAGNIVGTGGAADDLGGSVSFYAYNNVVGAIDSLSYPPFPTTDGNQVLGGGLNITTILDPVLRANGGPTLTHALAPGSPAINAGGNSFLPDDTLDLDGDGDTAEPIPFDQRGGRFARVLGGTVDIGAIEGTGVRNAWQIRDLSASAGSLLNYTANLTEAQRIAATNSGWRYTVSSRLVNYRATAEPAMFMIFGHGSRRYGLSWNFNANGDLTVQLLGGRTTNLTVNASGACSYHTYEVSGADGEATLRFDGRLVTTWSGEAGASQSNVVLWGSASAPGMGEMNFHRVEFLIGGTNLAALYDAGMEDDPLTAPHPVTQGWKQNPGSPSTGTGTTPVSPDRGALLPIVQTLAATEVGTSSARLNGQINPLGFPAAAWFQWGTTTNYGATTELLTLETSPGPARLASLITNLVTGQTYYFRLVATNVFGMSVAADQSFTPTWFAKVPIAAPPGGAWGDFDNDGRMDVLSGRSSQLYRNTGTGFTNVPVSGLPFFASSSAAWGDFDNDGRLDFLVAGNAYGAGNVAQVWRNTGNGFTNLPVVGLPGCERGSLAWGDYDNDGRLDFLITGLSSFSSRFDENVYRPIAQLWRNTGTGFTNARVAGLAGVHNSCVAWGDYDNDGRLDFLLTGTTNFVFGPNSILWRVSQLWRNTGNGFTNIPIPGLPSVASGSVAWGDADNDGRLDFLITGLGTVDGISVRVAQLWQNTGHGFTNVPIAGLLGVYDGAASWGDYDNDGRLDFLVHGVDGASTVLQLWRNTGVRFSHVPIAGLTGIPSDPISSPSAVAWVDYDNDGRLDFSATDFGLWRNQLPTTNSPPVAPTGLASQVHGNSVTLSWNPASDDQTPAPGLSYNLVVGATPGAVDFASPMSDLVTGFHRIVSQGTVGPNHSWTFTNLPPGANFYWSVQAVDTAFAGGPFAPQQSFRNLVITDFTRVGLGQNRIEFIGSAGVSYQIESSTDLINWTLLGSGNPFAPGRYRFTDNIDAASQRFYRVRYP